MGTEVQSKMYFPGYYSIQNLSNSVGHGSWSLLHENRNLKNGQQYDIFSTMPVFDGFHGSNKEQLRQTILKHESVFRHQLNELHRLYERQKDLMNEITSKEQLKHQKAAGTSQATLFSSGFPTEDDRKNWNISDCPLVHSSYGRPSRSKTGISQSHGNYIGETLQINSGPSPIRVRIKDYESSDSRGRRLIDLELPAEEYISDGEEPEGVVVGSGTENHPPNAKTKVTQAFNHIGETSGYNNSALSSSLNLERRNGLADLNEPIQNDKVSASTSVFKFGNDPSSKEEIERQVLSANAYKGIWPFTKKFPEGFSKRNQKERSTNFLKAEQTSSSGGSFGPQDFNKPCESSKTEARNSCEPAKVVLSGRSKVEERIKRTIFGIEISERDVNSSAKGSQSGVAMSESSPNWTKSPRSLSQNLLSAQGNISFNTPEQSNGASIMLQKSSEVTRERFLVDCNSIPSTPLNSEVQHRNGVCFRAKLEANELQACRPSISHGFPNGDSNHSSASDSFSHHGHQLHHSSLGCRVEAKSAIGVNDTIPLNKHLHGVTCEHNILSLPGRNQEIPQGKLHWLEAVPLCNGKSSKASEGSHQMKIDSLWNYSKKFVDRPDLRKGPSQSPIQGSSSLVCGNETKVESGDCMSIRKNLALPIFDKALPYPCSSSKSDCLSSAVDNGYSVRSGLVKNDMIQDPVSHMCREQQEAEGLVVENGPANDKDDSRHQLDLNRCLTEDETEMTTASPVERTETLIDLEAPVIVEMDIVREDNMEIKFKEHLDSSHERHIRVAAEALVVISSSQAQDIQNDAAHHLQESATCHEVDASENDSLLWFAEIISSHQGNFGNEIVAKVNSTTACDEESVPDVMDYFEYMTLNLVETKVEQYCCYVPPDSDNPKEEVTLSKRPRRGQARRGRQRKDFQRDVLAGLASLSRNEVTEDLQIIEGLIRETGGSWQSSLAQRNGGRSGKGRGRKRMGTSAPSSAVAEVSQLQIQQPEGQELQGLEERSITGWGKRTRRPPRQRYPINSSPVPKK